MWEEKDQHLVRDFQFSDFKEAFSFLTRVALVAEKQDHHPEIYNVYNRVTIKLTTHDKGNVISEKDHKLAQSIDELL